MERNLSKIIIAALFFTAIFVFFYFDLTQYINFSYLQSQKHLFQEFYITNPVLTLISFFLIYVVITALSLPGAAVMTLAGGYLFGLLWGTLLISFASTLGATLAFLMSRFVLRDFIQKKFSNKLQVINNGIEDEGVLYLITLRLIPIFPFFVINLVMGLTPIKTSHFYFFSQLAMLPGTLVFVNAGTQLAKLTSIQGIFSPQLLLSFALLGLFPFIVKKILTLIRRKSNETV